METKDLEDGQSNKGSSMLTTRRPIIGPYDTAPYIYLGGTLYFGNRTHPEMMREMLMKGIPRNAFNDCIAGYVENGSHDEVPEYVNEQFSDFLPSQGNPDQNADLHAKLDAWFPDIRHRGSSDAGWTLTPRSATMGDMSVTSIDAAIKNDTAATIAIRALTQEGGRVFVVGGAVRDAILGNTPKDIDLMVQGLDGDTIEAALANLGRLDYTGKQFGVYRFKSGQSEVEIALPRTEISTGPGHQDFSVTTDPHLDPALDLGRRDFTGNAMAYEPNTGTLLDPHGGAAHLGEGTLALVNGRAFEDDPLRIVRALVANARHGLEPDDQLKEALKDNAQKIKHLPGERIQAELDKLLTSDNPSKAVELAEESGVLDYLFPELSSTVGFDQQNPFHDLNVFEHTMMVLKAMTRLSHDPDLRLAALFHDSGKPDAFWQDEDQGPGSGGHFYKKVLDDGTVLGEDHEEVGANHVNAFMRRLRYPNDRIDRVTKLVKYHMFPYFNSTKGARKFLRALNGDVKMAFDLLTLREADASGKRDGTVNTFDRTHIDKSREMLQQVLDSEEGFTLKDLAVNGHDMMELGLSGRQIGDTLNKLLDLVVDNPALNDKSALMSLVKEGLSAHD